MSSEDVETVTEAWKAQAEKNGRSDFPMSGAKAALELISFGAWMLSSDARELLAVAGQAVYVVVVENERTFTISRHPLAPEQIRVELRRSPLGQDDPGGQESVWAFRNIGGEILPEGLSQVRGQILNGSHPDRAEMFGRELARVVGWADAAESHKAGAAG